MPPASVTNAMSMDHNTRSGRDLKPSGVSSLGAGSGSRLSGRVCSSASRSRGPQPKKEERAATIKAIEALGSERLQLLSQKERVAQIERVHADNDGLSVSDRLVRYCFTKARS